jgi:hypothetical protein
MAITTLDDLSARADERLFSAGRLFVSQRPIPDWAGRTIPGRAWLVRAGSAQLLLDVV